MPRPGANGASGRCFCKLMLDLRRLDRHSVAAQQQRKTLRRRRRISPQLRNRVGHVSPPFHHSGTLSDIDEVCKLRFSMRCIGFENTSTRRGTSSNFAALLI
jgi:hypothetical protein